MTRLVTLLLLLLAGSAFSAHNPGKILFVNNGDADRDGVPNFADGFGRFGTNGATDSGGRFTPIYVSLPVTINPAIALVRFHYAASAPLGVTTQTNGDDVTYAPVSGQLRLWTRDGTAARSPYGVGSPGGHFVVPGVDYPAPTLQFPGYPDYPSVATFYVEALSGCAQVGNSWVGNWRWMKPYVGGLAEGARGRGRQKKALVAMAAETDGPGIGRIRLARNADASRSSLRAFVDASLVPGTQVVTDGWEPYAGLPPWGYGHEVHVLRGQGADAATRLLPRVHRVAALLKRWLLGTHQGAVRAPHLDYYLDEFTFRFNRPSSASRGKLFYRLVQQAVAVAPAPDKELCGGNSKPLG